MKQQVIDVLTGLPDDSTLDEILMHIELWSGVPEAEEDIEAGRVYTSEEVKERIRQWPKSSGPVEL